jgi:hypothetical protein
MFRVAFTTMILAATMSGCGGGGGGGTQNPDAAANEPTINGKPASQFYGQFTWQMTKGPVDGAAAFETQPDGRNAYLATFFLMPDHVLKLFYAEGAGDVSATGWNIAIRNDAKKRRSGTWRIDGAKLVLDAFMTCGGLTLDERDTLRCELATAIVTPVAVGSGGFFDIVHKMQTPDDSEFSDYVP